MDITPDSPTNDDVSFADIIVCVISCCLSIFGAFFIFLSYITIAEIRNFTRRLLLCLTVADSLTSSGYLLSVSWQAAADNDYTNSTNKTEDHTICVIQSFITTYSSLVSFFLTVFIAVHIFVTVVTRDNTTGSSRWFVVFNLVSFGLPGIILLVALLCDVLGENLNSTGPWCWIKSDLDDGERMFWMLITGKGWEVACYLLTTTLYLTLKFYTYLNRRRERFHVMQPSLRDEDANFVYVWFILYVLRIWGTTRFFILNFSPSIDDYETIMHILPLLQSFGDPAQAFFNFVFFCLLDKTVRRKLFSMLSVCQHGCHRTATREQEKQRLLNKIVSHEICSAL